ncbi:MAG: thioredoxin [Bacteroidaceae bacterium]|nr:thioredoxin [Bacteroidaceae bacterium]
MKKEITNQNYNELVNSGQPVVIDFWATWCGPCRKVSPVIDELADEYDGRVIIGGCNVDENDELTAKFGIRNIPTIIFIKNGEIVDKVVGAAPKSTFQEKIEGLL